MKQVDFVQVSSEFCGFGLGKGNKYSFEGIEDTIRQRIQDGWEFCGYVPLVTRGTGEAETLSLIFQRDSE